MCPGGVICKSLLSVVAISASLWLGDTEVGGEVREAIEGSVTWVVGGWGQLLGVINDSLSRI